jgi:hypothetical protein
MKARVFVVAIVFIAVGLAVFAHLRALSGGAARVEEGHHARRVGRPQDRAANILIGASRDRAIGREPRSRAVPSL